MISKLNAMESKAPELKDALFSLEKLAKEEVRNIFRSFIEIFQFPLFPNKLT